MCDHGRCVVCFHGSSMPKVDIFLESEGYDKTTGRLQEDDRKSTVRFRPAFARNDGTFSRRLRKATAVQLPRSAPLRPSHVP